MPKAQPEQEIDPDRPHVEDDGCPTEKAVLQRFWREHQKQEPVAWGFQNTGITGSNRWMYLRETIPAEDQYRGVLWTPLYTAPPQREWVDLTDKEHEQIAIDWGCVSADWVLYGAAVERKLKEKNT